MSESVWRRDTHRAAANWRRASQTGTPYGQRNSVDGEGEGLMTSHDCHV